MKKLIVLICTMTFIATINCSNAQSSMRQSDVKDTVLFWTSAELIEVANTWASAYEQNQSETKIVVSEVNSDKLATILNDPENIVLTNKYLSPEIENSKLWKMTVGRDIIVPVTNANNPYLENIFKHGISPEKISDIFQNNGKLSWGSVLENQEKTPVNLYYCNEKSQKLYLSEFLGVNFSNDKSSYHNTEEVLDQINKNSYALGFCNILDVIDRKSLKIKEGLSFVPIDVNKNHKIDFFEDIYKTSEELERAVWIGKYPKALYSDLYIVSKNIPTEEKKNEFVHWILTKGQQNLSSLGYSELIYGERLSKTQKLYESPVPIENISKPNQSFSFLTILFILLAVFSIPVIAFLYFKTKKSQPAKQDVSIRNFFTEATVLAPNGLFYDKSHTWTFLEKDGSVRVGIADFLQHITGKITKVKTRKAGEMINKGEPFLTLIQDGKQVNIPSPVSGKIKKINSNVESNASMINTDPYSEGWVYLVESPNFMEDIKTYFVGQSYKEWLNKELVRLKDFFASITKINLNNDLELVLQEGGELSDHPLEDLGPIIWEEFQQIFIDRKKA